MRVSEKKAGEVANCEMVFGGQKLDQALLMLASNVSVDLAIGKPGLFTLEMEGYGANQDFKWMDNPRFALGTLVEVKMGYQPPLTPLFVGEIVGVDAAFSASGPPRLTVRAYDLSHRLTRGKKRRTFSKLKYSDIARTLAAEAGLTPRVTDSGEVREYVEQNEQSDFGFLLNLAEEIHYHLFVVRKQMVFEPVSNNSNASLKLSLEDDLTDFQPNLSLARQVSGVMVRGWDAQKRSEIVGSARAGDEGSTMGGQKSASRLVKETFDNSGKVVRLISNHPVMTQSEADTLAQARLKERSLELIEATGTTMGRADLLPGQVVEISGVSKWFSGRYYLSDTTHRYDYESGYTTRFEARRNAL
jgi:Bacteriophage probable baseplate hub protein